MQHTRLSQSTSLVWETLEADFLTTFNLTYLRLIFSDLMRSSPFTAGFVSSLERSDPAAQPY